jgi:RNA polymerase sigma-70 factor (ECF subfamily)
MATTQWSQVLAARDGSDTEARAALESLCGTYWEPLYAFVRHQGSSPDEAGDLTQAYFAELLEKDFLSAVDPGKGRFRSFLLASMKNFLSHERERASAQKRGGGRRILSLDVEGAEQRYGVQPTAEMSPDEAFEYRWAVTMLNRALERLQQDSSASGRAEQFEVLRQYLTSTAEETPYREAASRLRMSEGAVKMAVSRLRARLGQCLRAEVADTVADPSEIDDEVRQLLQALRA